jgi:homocitrate synthase NifV
LQHPEAFEAIPADVVGNRRMVRVRSRLKPALLEACLPPAVREEIDLDEFVNEVLAQLSPEIGALTDRDLLEFAEDHRRRRVAVAAHPSD